MNSNIFVDAMQAVTDEINKNKDFLTDLDREIGDGDHGANLSRGFNAVMEKLKTAPPADIQAGLKTVAMTLISTVGGASGPLYGTAFLRASKVAGEELDANLLLKMLREAIDGIEARGGAKVGDKTMIDALEPAYKALDDSIKSGDDIITALEAACDAAEKGIEYTKTIIALKGRASYLGERSIGHQDPGATSVTIVMQTFTRFYKERGKE